MTITESIATESRPGPGDEHDRSTEPPKPSPLNLGVFAGLAMALVGLGLGASRIADNSFLTHLATGRQMLESGIVREDVFTWTSAGQSTVVQSWLASLLYGVVDAAAGFHGLRLLTAVLAAVLAALAWRLTASSPSMITRLAIMVPVLLIGEINWSERPLLLAFVLFAGTMAVVEGDGRPRWLVVVGVLWVNIHGSWPLGLVYLATRIAGGALDRTPTKRDVTAAKYLGAGMVFGGIVNPYGPALLFFPVRLLGRQEVLQNIVEWQSPSFGSLWTRAFLLMILGALVAARRGAPWRDVLPAMIFIAAALVGRRNIPIASLVLIPLLARSLPAVGRLAADRASEAVRLGCLALIALLVVVPLVAMGGPHVDVDRFPEDAVSAMETELGLAPGETRIIHQDFVGNYLDVRYGDAAASWIDDRFELHDADLVNDYIILLDGAPAWSQVLERYDAEAILWPTEGVLVELAREVGGWSTVWTDDTWTVLCAPGHEAC